MSTSPWIFPHSTCEHVSTVGIIQPLSFGMNMINVLLLIRAAYFASTIASRRAIGSFVLFETIHMISHAVHLNTNIHEVGVHVCLYLMAATIFQVLYTETNYVYSRYNKFSLLFVISVDLLVFSTIRSIYSIATGLSVLVTTVIPFIPKLDGHKYTIALAMIRGVVLLVGMFIVEMNYCHQFQIYNIDFHPLIELWGILLFQLLVCFVNKTPVLLPNITITTTYYKKNT
jgi:hypothetical protein